MINIEGIICFFYVDDFAIAYPKGQKGAAKEVIQKLKNRFKIKDQGELE